MFCVYTRPRYQVSFHRTIGPLVFNTINTSGYFVAWTIYTSHTDKFAPKHTILLLLGSVLKPVSHQPCRSRTPVYEHIFGEFRATASIPFDVLQGRKAVVTS